MEKATIIGIDLVKRVFQVHRATQDGDGVEGRQLALAAFSGLPGGLHDAVHGAGFQSPTKSLPLARSLFLSDLAQLGHWATGYAAAVDPVLHRARLWLAHRVALHCWHALCHVRPRADPSPS